MGNCQATDAAAAVIRHPDGSLERLFWPTTVGEVMRRHPGHYVALITFHISGDSSADDDTGSLRFTRLRILRHKDLLITGQVYRLISCQEVARVLHARKQERAMDAQVTEQNRQRQSAGVEEGDDQASQHEREKLQKLKSSKQWRPSLKSISEGPS